jgi:quercetin dioxygenase-like cupin family protein
MKRLQMSVERRVPFANPIFEGGQVSRQTFVGNPSEDPEVVSDTVRVQLVAFEPGARTRLHVHTTDQVLVITEGRGYVGTPDGYEVVSAGDIVHIYAGEPHFHGATERDGMAHLSIITPGSSFVVDHQHHWPSPVSPAS